MLGVSRAGVAADALTLALAAQAASKSELPKARQLATELLQRSPKSVEAADLLGEIELAASLPERGRPAGRPRRALGVERLADHPEREELVPLEPQDGLEPLDVLVGEEPIAAPGSPRPEQALILEVTDLRDRDVGKLLA